jgi:hypothetical protein
MNESEMVIADAGRPSCQIWQSVSELRLSGDSWLAKSGNDAARACNHHLIHAPLVRYHGGRFDLDLRARFDEGRDDNDRHRGVVTSNDLPINSADRLT